MRRFHSYYSGSSVSIPFLNNVSINGTTLQLGRIEGLCLPSCVKNSTDRKGVLNLPDPSFKLMQKSYAIVLNPCIACLFTKIGGPGVFLSFSVLIALLVLPRFHLLPEFDQGKRSCRRRLAGHNERRRKPPSGSVLSARHGRFSPSLFDNSSRAGGGLVVDFSAYPRHTGRDGWPAARSSELAPGNDTAAPGRSISHMWQINSQNPPSNLCLQGSTGGTGLFSSGIPPGECFTGVAVSDSSCALSLLSNQPWGSTNRASSLAVNDLFSAEEAPVVQSTANHGAAVNQYPIPWSFKSNEGSNSSHEMCPDLGLGQISLPLSSHLPGQLEQSQQSRRQYMDLEHSRAYDSSTQHIHWSL
ncbi:hypothetical protein NC652_036220 [Populus alba x Populus x berolinensis]|nr:hypothetical protein NC652_036220 [Populus alba x Populus x berolinensis]